MKHKIFLSARKCPKCDKRHFYKSTALRCLANAENYRTLYIIGIQAGGKEGSKSLQAKRELKDMERYYSLLKDR